MTNLESRTLEAIKDLAMMFGEDCDTIATSTLIENASEYGLNAKQIRANLVTLQTKGIVELSVHGEQLVTIR